MSPLPACQCLPGEHCLQARRSAVAPLQGGQHAQRAQAYRGLVQELLALNVRDKAAAQALAAAVLQAVGGGGNGGAAAEE